MVGPLIWLLVFDALVCGIWWLMTSVLGVTGPARLVQLMVGLVILINVVIVVFWLLQILGVAPGAMLQGPKVR